MRSHLLLLIANLACLMVLGSAAGPACLSGADNGIDDNRNEGRYSEATENSICAAMSDEQDRADCHEILAIGSLYRCGVDCTEKAPEEQFQCIVSVNSEEMLAKLVTWCGEEYGSSSRYNQCLREVSDLCDYNKLGMISASDYAN